jgi:hypothetical protein
MRRTLLAVAAAFNLTVLSFAGGGGSPETILPEVSEHLRLARRCALSGNLERGLAHTEVVSPDKKIRVRVDCGDLTGSQQTPMRNALAGAMKLWSDALGEDLFEVGETGIANVIVKFQLDVRDRGVSVAAHVDWTRGVANELVSPTPVLTAQITMRTRALNGMPLDFDQMRASLAHELGHVIGLSDSRKPGMIMSVMDYRHPALNIQYSEVAELMQARREAKALRVQFLAKAQKAR